MLTHATEPQQRAEVYFHAFSTWKLKGASSPSRSGRSAYRERAHCVPLTGYSVGYRAGLHVLEREKHFLPLPGIENFLGFPDRSLVITLSYLHLHYTKSGCRKICETVPLHSITASDVRIQVPSHFLFYDRKETIANEVYNTPIRVPILRDIWRFSKPILRFTIYTCTQTQIREGVT
jgi:hypothetical protein